MTVPPGVQTPAAGRSRRLRFDSEAIDMSHGAGGKATHKLIEGLIQPALENPMLAPLADAALIEFGGSRLALTTDSFVVRPLQFPGGSIGELAVNGTVNDLAVSGAVPLALSSALILEEGLDAEILRRELDAIGRAADLAAVSVAAGDTKVVERGKGDELYIITTGIGVMRPDITLSSSSVRPGDKIILSGTLGDHGVAIMIARGNLDLEAEVASDTRPLLNLVSRIAEVAGENLRFMRDPTRGEPRSSDERAGPGFGPGNCASERRLSPSETLSTAPARFLASTHCTLPTRASWSLWSPPKSRTPSSTRCVRKMTAATQRSSARSPRCPREWF